MIYLLYGVENFLINQEIKKIVSTNNIDRINISEYNMECDSISTILRDATTSSLFDDKKIIVVNNAIIFTNNAKKDENTIILEEYLKNSNPETIIIFTLNNAKIDNRKKIVELIKKNGVIEEFNNVTNLNQTVIDLFNPYQISNNTAHLLIERVGKDISLLYNIIDQIKIYKDKDLVITDNDINLLTSKNVEADIFELINSIVFDNKEKAISIYHELLKYNEEPIKIIIMIANNFRMMYQSKELYKKGYTENNIASYLNTSPARIGVLNRIGRNFNSEDLLKYIAKLADIDYKIKSGMINKNIALELFIIEK